MSDPELAGPSRSRRVLRKIGRALLLVVAAYLVVRALIEPFVINPSRPESYRQDWGGPHYLGVVLVHCVPGLVTAILAIRWFRQRGVSAPSSPHRS